MPQLEEDEWPEPAEPTTTERQSSEETANETRDGVRSEYPPKLPPEALPTRD